MRLSRRLLALMLVLFIPAAALACLWDSETLKQERARFPSTLELITGKFLRHSQEFYQWRIKDRQEKLKADPKNLGYYDDIAVAYEKLGQHDKAIETILAKEEIEPGLYETYSNLGTFHILAGDFEKGLPYIDKALAINPDAHFGREKYQKWLVEYAMTRMKDGKLAFPIQRPSQSGQDQYYSFEDDFSEFIAQRSGTTELSDAEASAAIKGVLGMMRFADHQNPLLLEALGDLLMAAQHSDAARNLATRAFLQASFVTNDTAVQQQYRELAERALSMQTGTGSSDQLPLTDLDADFKKELADADEWYAVLEKQERQWISEGADVEANFDRLYSEEPAALVSRETAVERIVYSPVETLMYPPVLAGILALVVVVASTVWWRWCQRKAKPA